MTYNVWNARLQLLCIEAGLMERYTSFSWRRGSLTVLKSQKGMKFAEDVAGHVSRGRSIYVYVKQPVVDTEIVEVLSSVAEDFLFS